jgi:hypothetical protein
MTRTPLPTRRPSTTVDAIWQDQGLSVPHELTVTVGLYPDGRPGEVFVNTAKGGQMQAVLADACVLVSLLLQHGVSPADMAKSLGRVPDLSRGKGDTAPASPIGAVVEALL